MQTDVFYINVSTVFCFFVTEIKKKQTLVFKLS